jgi:hypothetical protein
MQFLAYLIILMVSVSTVLLEVHWLTTPPSQPKPAVQAASAPPPVPKTEGPNAALSPVYPKKPPSMQPAEPANTEQASAPMTTTAQAAPATETTGVAAREDETRQGAQGAKGAQAVQAAAVGNASSRSDNPQLAQVAVVRAGAVASSNRCDVQACSSTYRSFRASDCTYQPFEGERRFCGKPAMQRTAREQRDEPGRRQWIRNTTPRNVEQRAREIDSAPDTDDEDSPEFVDSEREAPALFFFGGRARW